MAFPTNMPNINIQNKAGLSSWLWMMAALFMFTKADADNSMNSDVFESIDILFEECPDESDALVDVYGGLSPALACAECAWTPILREISSGCVDIDTKAFESHESCVASSICDRGDHAAAAAQDVFYCAKALYCDEELEEPSNFLENNNFLENVCFSLKATVEVQGKGTTAIKDLVIGDMVLSDEHGNYSKFYSFGRYEGKEHANFFRIYTEMSTKPLEITPTHFIFTTSSDLPVPSHSIKVGDSIKTSNGSSKVTFIKQITRKGFINPLTLSGTTVVDGIVTSNHIEFATHAGGENKRGWLYIAGYKAAHWHYILRFIYAPHRLLCGHIMTCTQDLTQEKFDPSAYHRFLKKVYDFVIEKESVVLSTFLLLIFGSIGAVFTLLELLFENPVICVIIIGGLFLVKSAKNKSGKAKLA